MERKQPSIEELLNTIEFLKKALEYYENTSNYNPNNPNILKDQGHQARFALRQCKVISNFNKEIIDEYNNMLKEINNNVDDEQSMEKFNKLNEIINKYKKINENT